MATLAQTEPSIVAPKITSTRLLSLDVFRGITIASMILVNDAGDWGHIYWPLGHAPWHGWTPTDLIFPFFLFIVGVSMVLSFNSRRARGATRGELMLHSLKRAAIIFGLGLFLALYPRFDFSIVRIPGVLQRIAVVYLLASAIVLYFGRKTRMAITAVLLLGYWAAMMLIPVPGYGAGVLSADGSLASYVDRLLLYNHLYVSHRFDPEGILSTFPAIATCLFGVFTGEWIRGKEPKQLVRGLLIGAVVGLALGKIWNIWFPINKNLWTSSYVLFCAGFAMAVFAVCYWLVDFKGWKRWAQPFVWFGVNPLAIFFLASWFGKATSVPWVGGIRIKSVVYGKVFANLFPSPYMNSLAFAVCFVLLFWFIAWALYQKKIFIRV
ncbi:MAG TPA: hypothetical protein VN577_21620 [Terriglobales bacterium]|nr:hypothetical protein [Terriglobales bacterium]